MRTALWLLLLAVLVACGKYGDPQRHPPQPRPAATQPEPAQETEVDEP